ncbi:MFS transporter [Vibrio sp. D404a]|uniref:MFS transporter n=1 Tax=unclassified Vibrio TaxID=2614977 RepID=UPI002556DD94|nr:MULTISPECIES: MFS transporter [unclassified Vibrio]MDK9736785.1 MFS transporter [Vibrio sp. D404a]MDK9795797.1 MFS transporter [Vibrio sp. D449a]
MKNKTPPYLAGRFFDGISSGLFMLALPWLMLAQPGQGSFVALTALICTLTTFCATPYFSAMIDRHSRKQILVWMQVIQFITAFLVALVYTLNWGNLWVFGAAQVVFWVSSNLAWHTNNAFTQENYDQAEYAKISSYQEIVMQSTTLGAGALGVILLEQWSIIEFGIFAGFASLLATISYLVTPYRRQVTPQARTPFKQQIIEIKQLVWQSPEFFAFLMASCLSYPVLTYLSRLVPIWFSEIQITGDWLALYNIALGVGALFIGLLLPKILKMASHQSVMNISMLVIGITLLAIGQVTEPTYIILLTLVLGAFNALNRIARTNWMHHAVDMGQRGRVDGGLTLFATLTQSLSYVLIAFLASVDAIVHGFVIAGVIVLAAALWMTKLAKQIKPECTLSNQCI